VENSPLPARYGFSCFLNQAVFFQGISPEPVPHYKRMSANAHFSPQALRDSMLENPEPPECVLSAGTPESPTIRHRSIEHDMVYSQEHKRSGLLSNNLFTNDN